jgi:hypothetical protein
MASRPAGNREPSMREVTARPYFFSKRSRARACPGAELRVSSLPGPASPSSDSKVESQLNRTSSSQIKVKTGRRTGVVVSDHVRRDSNGLENLAEFWDEPASVKSCTASNMCSTTTSRHLNAVHSSSDMSLCGSSLQGGSAPNSRVSASVVHAGLVITHDVYSCKPLLSHIARFCLAVCFCWELFPAPPMSNAEGVVSGCLLAA